MAAPASQGMVVPNFRTPRLFGIFNVLFSTQILVCGLCLASYVVTLPLWARLTGQAQQQMVRQAEAIREAELDAVEAKEKAAGTAGEKASLAARRKEIESRPKPVTPGVMDLNKLGFNEPGFLAWSWTDVGSSLVLNVMMLASGVGLLHWRPWARSLAVWTAALKIARLVVLYSIFIVMIVPTMSQRMGEAVGEMMEQQGTGQMIAGTSPGPFFARVYTFSYTAMGLGIMLAGLVYPALLLWYLTRPGVKVACSGTMRLPKEPNQPW